MRAIETKVSDVVKGEYEPNGIGKALKNAVDVACRWGMRSDSPDADIWAAWAEVHQAHKAWVFSHGPVGTGSSCGSCSDARSTLSDSTRLSRETGGNSVETKTAGNGVTLDACMIWGCMIIQLMHTRPLSY